MSAFLRVRGLGAVTLRSGVAAALALAAVVMSALPFAGIGDEPQARAAEPAPGVVLPNGRLATPAGSPYDALRKTGDASYDLGDFPLGLALSPDGRLAVTSLNGYGQGVPQGFNSTCQADTAGKGGPCPGVAPDKQATQRVHAPDEGLDVIDLASGKVTQAVSVPTNYDKTKPRACRTTINCFGIGVAFSPDGKHVYATGAGADQVYDFAVNGSRLALAHAVDLPGLVAQEPSAPVAGRAAGTPRGLAVTADGSTLVVASEFDSTVSLFDLGPTGPRLAARGLVPGGLPAVAPLAYLYGVASSPDSQWAYVTAQGTGLVYTVNLAALRASGALGTTSPLPGATAPITAIAPGLDHPTGVAVSADGGTLAVTGTNSDNVALIALQRGVPTLPARLVAVKAAEHAGALGSAPDAVTFSKDGKQAWVAMAGDDALAVVDTAAGKQLGAVPTGWYPTAVAVGPKDGRVYAVSAKGLGSRYVPVLGYTARPGASLPVRASIPNADYYDGDNMPGLLTRVTIPSAAALAEYTARARLDIEHATGADQRPADSPIPAPSGGPSPITHIVYVVRENRTYDQVFGDLKRKDADVDPHYQELAAATPNAHGIAGRFATADHFFSDGEASVQGHWWTAAANSSDYIEKSWRQYYSSRNRPYDPIGTVPSAPGCSIFQSLQRYQTTHPTFTFRNYGELIGVEQASTNITNPSMNACSGGAASGPGSIPTDPNYPSQISLTPDDRTRSAEFLKDSGLNPDGKDAGNGNTLRNFNYLILSEDHTSGLAGTNTPRSQVAQNDQALGQIVSALSKSNYWSSTAVFVVEDDSQDGYDHVDGHRNILLAASPWTRQISGDGCAAGYIGHAHYDQASVLRTMELILGVPPLSAYDAGAPPLYDLFQPTSRPALLTPGSLKPYQVRPAPSFVDETVASLPRRARTAELMAASRALNLRGIDRAGPALESILWQSVRDDAPPIAPTTDTEVTGPRALRAAGEPDLARPGSVPSISITTGRPVTAATRCVAVGQHPGTAASASALSARGPLPATGPGWGYPVGGLLLLLCAAGFARPGTRPSAKS